MNIEGRGQIARGIVKFIVLRRKPLNEVKVSDTCSERHNLAGKIEMEGRAHRELCTVPKKALSRQTYYLQGFDLMPRFQPNDVFGGDAYRAAVQSWSDNILL